MYHYHTYFQTNLFGLTRIGPMLPCGNASSFRVVYLFNTVLSIHSVYWDIITILQRWTALGWFIIMRPVYFVWRATSQKKKVFTFSIFILQYVKNWFAKYCISHSLRGNPNGPHQFGWCILHHYKNKQFTIASVCSAHTHIRLMYTYSIMSVVEIWSSFCRLETISEF